jgi:hypothetical protein
MSVQEQTQAVKKSMKLLHDQIRKGERREKETEQKIGRMEHGSCYQTGQKPMSIDGVPT